MNLQTLFATLTSHFPHLVLIITVGLQVLGSMVILATVIAKATVTKKDDEIMNEIDSVLLKVLNFMPTIGVDPRTQKLQDALEDAQSQLEKKAA
jgi:DNA polymerase I-like protein with 3'-5' exonuclease and polymerase domains